MQIEKENEENAIDSFMCPSFSTYTSNNLNDVAQQVINENDNSISQNYDFEFVAFQKTSDEVFFDHRRRNTTHRVFPIFNRDGDKRNSDAAEISIPLRKLMIRDEKRNIDPLSPFSSEVADDLDAVPPASYCLWTPKSPMASPIKCKKSKSGEKNLPIVTEKKNPVMERNIPAPVTAMEAFYLRKKAIKRKSYLPYKQELIGFGVGFNANIGRGFPLPV